MNINNFTQWKKKWNNRCDVHVQSGRSTWGAVDIFNTLHVFAKEPIREQEIK